MIKRRGKNDYYQLLPIRIGFVWKYRSWKNWFTWHGWQTGHFGFGRRVFGWTFHLGPLKLYFGGKNGPVLLTLQQVEALWHEGLGLERMQWESHHPEDIGRHYLKERSGNLEFSEASKILDKKAALK